MPTLTPLVRTAPRSRFRIDQGPFVTVFNFPGRLVPERGDHGYGPLATVVESFLAPGTWIPLHEHRDEDIVSWVPHGVMRHYDPVAGHLVTDSEHLLVMNAGRGFWHEERTREDDPPLRMLQIFVRPPRLGMEPGVQHGPIRPSEEGTWRLLFGPEGSGAPFRVTNAVELFDLRLPAGARATLPWRTGHGVYLYVFDGRVRLGPSTLGRAESALVEDDPEAEVEAVDNALLVAFRVDPAAPVTRSGTIGR